MCHTCNHTQTQISCACGLGNCLGDSPPMQTFRPKRIYLAKGNRVSVSKTQI